MTEERARREDWKCEPFGSGVVLPFAEAYSHEEFNVIARGLIPRAMEDKWFVFLEEATLYLHRSWTGTPVYKVVFETLDTGVAVSEAHVSVGKDQPLTESLTYHAELLHWLIGCLLLGKDLAFPMPPEIEAVEGLFQHHIAGTGYAEKVISPKPWWRFW